MKKLFTLLCASVLVAACAGTPVDWNKARSVKVGMTEKELTSIMGSPYVVSSRKDGQVWIYSHGNGLTGAGKSVSYVLRDGRVVEVPRIPDSF